MRHALTLIVLATALGACGGSHPFGTPEPPLDPWPVGTHAPRPDDAKPGGPVWLLHMAPGVRFEHLHVRCAEHAVGEMIVDETRVIEAPEGCAVHGESIDAAVDFTLPDGAPGPVLCDAAGVCSRME